MKRLDELGSFNVMNIEGDNPLTSPSFYPYEDKVFVRNSRYRINQIFAIFTGRDIVRLFNFKGLRQRILCVDMKNDIANILDETPGLKGREIAHRLSKDRKEVNSFLSKNKDSFFQDGEFRWFNKTPSEMRIHLDGGTWVDGLMLDRAIGKSGSPLESDCDSVLFVVPEGCKIFLEAEARLLALSNQCVYQGKTVTIDFDECEDTLSFFDRNGFFDLLDSRVIVKPNRTQTSMASIFQGNSDAVYEFAEINTIDPDEKIPQRLKNSFVRLVEETLREPGIGAKYSDPAFLVLSELFGNVEDHSDSPLPGYIALQRYKGHRGRYPVKPHIQTIVSDSGKGIVGTLRPVLESRYPDIYNELDVNDPSSSPLLVKTVFERGQISQSPDEGRGLGLKRSGVIASKYNAKVSVREDHFELKLSFKDGELDQYSYELDLPKINGTHICFDFILAKSL